MASFSWNFTGQDLQTCSKMDPYKRNKIQMKQLVLQSSLGH